MFLVFSTILPMTLFAAAAACSSMSPLDRIMASPSSRWAAAPLVDASANASFAAPARLAESTIAVIAMVAPARPIISGPPSAFTTPPTAPLNPLPACLATSQAAASFPFAAALAPIAPTLSRSRPLNALTASPAYMALSASVSFSPVFWSVTSAAVAARIGVGIVPTAFATPDKAVAATDATGPSTDERVSAKSVTPDAASRIVSLNGAIAAAPSLPNAAPALASAPVSVDPTSLAAPPILCWIAENSICDEIWPVDASFLTSAAATPASSASHW